MSITILADPEVLVEIDAIAVIGQKKQRLNPDTMFKPRVFTNIVQAGKTAYISGQAPVDKTGALVGRGDVDAQIVQMYKNLKVALEAIGAAPLNVVRAPMYYIRPEYYANIISAREEFWGPAGVTPPSMPIIGMPNPDWLVSIEAIAVLD